MTIDEMKERKKELGYSCEKIAELAKLPYATVQKIFTGITKAPRRQTILALEGVLQKRPVCYETIEYIDDKAVFCVREKGVEYRAAGEVFDNEGKRKGPYTIEDYYKLPEDKRFELIDGYFYEMYSPTVVHQEILIYLCIELSRFVSENGGDCRVLPAPLDVKLDDDDKTMVEPDVVVICDKDKITKKRIEGAPDMVMEILSPSTAKKDTSLKLSKYLDSGIREYWVIDPDGERVVVYYNGDESALIPAVYGFDAKIPVNIWDGRCVVDFNELREKLDGLK